jgi:hypothetical protein
MRRLKLCVFDFSHKDFFLLVLFMYRVVILNIKLRGYGIKLRCLLDLHVFLILMRG